MMDEKPAAVEGSELVTASNGQETAAAEPNATARPIGHIVGVGASAGGLEALEQFFQALPIDSGLSFVVVQHLSPNFRSLMDELLGRYTRMPIHRIEAQMPIEPNCVYLNPPRKNVVLQDGQLQLVELDPAAGLNLPIDVFLTSLAKEIGERSIAIILSGTGSDGTRGARAVKEAGGVVLAQDPETAKFDGMPRSAIATGLVDFVLSPAGLAEHLQRFVKHPFARGSIEAPLLPDGSTKLDEVIRILRTTHGMDFTYYKPNTISRRIERRMGINHLEDLDEYLRMLQANEAESRALLRDLLIGVTQFFRDTEVWRKLRTQVIPRLLSATPPTQPLRLWCAACASGEEAYSLAMVVQECLEQAGQEREVKIFATDVDPSAIERASAGVFPESIISDVGPDLANRFFQRRGETFEVRRELRETILFAQHNLLRDPPFTRVDMICCRNLLIYLKPVMQRRVLSLFHFALTPKSVLLLGASETVGDATHAFHALFESQRIYEKIPGAYLSELTSSPPIDLATRLRAPLLAPDRRVREAEQRTPIDHARDLILSRFAPAGVLLNEQFEVVHTFGDVSKFMQMPKGTFTSEALRLTVPELQVGFATALHRAARANESTAFKGLRLSGDTNTAVDLCIEPVRDPLRERKFYLALFEARESGNTLAISAEVFDESVQARQRISDLELELQQTRESLQATVEELETSNEELQSTNEELLAANEELQSTNEELHSVNEELYTVNSEYLSKINELLALTNDFENLLRSTDDGIVFVDADLRVRRFTPAATGFINLVEHDLGRPIQHFTHNIEGVDFAAALREIIESRAVQSREVRARDGRWLLLHMRPFITVENHVEGAVLAFIDISALKQSQRTAALYEEFLYTSLDALPANIAILKPDGEILHVNAAWRRFATENSLRSGNACVGDNYFGAVRPDLAPNPDEPRQTLEGIRAVIRGERDRYEDTYPCHSPTTQRWFTLRVAPFPESPPRRVVISHEDITQQMLVQAERFRLAALVDSSADAIVACELSGAISGWNRAATQLFGKPREAMLGQPIATLAEGYSRRDLQTAFARVTQGGGVVQFELSRPDARPEPLTVLITLSPIVENERMVGVSAIGRDITPMLRAESELRSTAAALAEANTRLKRSKEDLERLATISVHDLQEPLRTIKGYSELLRTQSGAQLDAQAAEFLGRISAGADRLQEMITDLRRITRISAEPLGLHETDVSGVVGRVVADLDARIREAGATVKFDALPAVSANPSLLGQLFQNLIDNAIKYRGDAQPQIVISAERKDREWVFGVRDNGMGIKPEYHERIFQVFRRLHPRSEYPGTGVGLAIARKIVDKHGGRIWVESQPAAGSTFFFTLPVEAPSAAM